MTDAELAALDGAALASLAKDLHITTRYLGMRSNGAPSDALRDAEALLERVDAALASRAAERRRLGGTTRPSD